MKFLLKIILILALAFLVYLSIAQVLVVPLEAESDQLLKELRLLRTQRVEIIRQQAEQKAKLAAYQTLRSEIEKIKLDIPPQGQITKLIAQLPEIANKNKVFLKGVTYKPLTKVYQNYHLLEFTMPISGNYQDIRRFIYELEKLKTSLVINSLNLKQSLPGGNVSIQVQASAYYQKL